MLYSMRATMPYDASNRKDVRAAERQARLADQQRREIITGIMSVAPGRRWMCELLETCHIFATSFSDVALRMSFMEGQREIGLRLLMDIMGACPNSYVQMMEERNARQSAADARFVRRDSPDGDGRDKGPGADDSPGSDDSADFDDDRAGAEPS
jgi:hypothetical protein